MESIEIIGGTAIIKYKFGTWVVRMNNMEMKCYKMLKQIHWKEYAEKRTMEYLERKNRE